jgi:hypothetical protein
MSTPSLAEALSSWLTNMAQRGIAPMDIDKRMVMMWTVIDYLDSEIQYSSTHIIPVRVEDIVTAHYGHYDNLINDHGIGGEKIKELYDSVNSFLAFIANEYKLPVLLLKAIKENVGKNRKGVTRHHLSLIGVLRNMERKQKRGIVGVLIERHRELKEVDDLMRRIMG